MVTDQLQNGRENNLADTWFVRNEQGGCFGPVTLEVLKGWVKDGRVAPTNKISNDNSTWQIASGFEALEMFWVAEIKPGNFYGPIHADVIKELRKEGLIAEKAFLFKRERGDDELINKTSLELVICERETAVKTIKILEARLQEAQQLLAFQVAEVQALQHKILEQSELAERERAVLEAYLAETQKSVALGENIMCATQQCLLHEAEQAQKAQALVEAQVVQAESRIVELEQALGASRQKLLHAAEQAQKAQALVEAQVVQAQSLIVALEQSLSASRQQLIQMNKAVACLHQKLEEERLEALKFKEQSEESIGDLRRKLDQANQQVDALQKQYEGRLAVLENQLAQKAQEQQDVFCQAEALRVELAAHAECVISEKLRLEESLALLQIEKAQRRQIDAVLAEKQSEIESLRALLSQRSSDAEKFRAVEADNFLEAEPLDAMPLKKSGTTKSKNPTIIEAQVVSAEEIKAQPRYRPPFFKTNHKGAHPDTSLLELEKQARCELERLGAQGKHFFFKKK